jgi:hypothetical protein|tara:strand:+ start:105 stop:689 length:585 start_codon:yes stop_codon:yes gene_type:complete
MATQDSRIRIKRSTVALAQPTAAPSTDHTDGTWSVNDVYIGELYLNDTDQRLYIRTTNGILEIATGGGELKRAQITLTAAQVLALNSTPIEVVAGISGKEIQVVNASMHLKYNTTAYATYVNMVLKASSAAAADIQARGSINATTDSLASFDLFSTELNIVTGDALVVSVDGGNPTAGDSDIVVDVLYRITDLP